MIRRSLAAAAAVASFLAASLVASVGAAQPASAEVSGPPWVTTCATGAVVSHAPSPTNSLFIDVVGTITPCGYPSDFARYAWVVFTSYGDAVLYPYFEDFTLTTTFELPRGFTAAVAICLNSSSNSRLGCFRIDPAGDGTVVLSDMSVNDPRVAGKPIVVEPIYTDEPPTCATCV